MNRNTSLNRHPLFQSIAAAALLIAFAAPVCAIAADPATPSSTNSTATYDQRIVARIMQLHNNLEITPDQESKWKKVTAAMLENSSTMRPLIEARNAKAATSTAVDGLKLYVKIAKSHADGVMKFSEAFEPLYDSMSDAQKKTADALFRKREDLATSPSSS